MELLVLGLLLGAGAAKRKEVAKALAKGYMTAAETTAHLREDMRAAIEEAQMEQDRKSTSLDEFDLAASEERFNLAEGAAFDHHATHDGTLPIDPDSTDRPKASRSVLKSVAKSLFAISELTRSASATIREDLRDAVEEARYEREQASNRRTAQSPPGDVTVPSGNHSAESKQDSPVAAAPMKKTKTADTSAAKPKTPRTRTPKAPAAPPTAKVAPPKRRSPTAAPKDAGLPPAALGTGVVTAPKTAPAKAAQP